MCGTLSWSTKKKEIYTKILSIKPHPFIPKIERDLPEYKTENVETIIQSYMWNPSLAPSFPMVYRYYTSQLEQTLLDP